jgi:CSLREA domain-containing protein
MRAVLPSYSLKVRLSLVTAVALSILFGVAIHVSRAATPISVTTVNDVVKTDGYCSLREAIIAANKDQASSSQPGECAAGSGADTIIIPAGTYALARTDNGKEDSSATGDLDILASVTISPTGPVTITAISGFSDRIFHVLCGNLTILNATISKGNVTGSGGAIFVAGAASLTLKNSTLTDNAATERGGGIYNAGTLTLVNDTISKNRVTRSGAGYGGGGIYQASGAATLLNVTLANNSGSSGGNVNIAKGAFSLKNTLIANGSTSNCTGKFTSSGYNLSTDTTCAASLNQAGDRNNAGPQLGPLQDNGGWTMTHALSGNSPAVDAGTTVGCPATDQRGQPRPAGTTCDIGSYENQDPIQSGPVFTINQPGDANDGACTYLDCKLREAISAANARPNGSTPDRIQFNLPGNAPYTIYLSSTLPAMSSPVIIDGSTQPGGALSIDGSTAAPGSDCFLITSSGSTLQALTIRSCPAAGIRVQGGTGNALRRNSIYDNGALGIDLGTDRVTPNDSGDADTGPNDLQNFPMLRGSYSQIEGRLNSAAGKTYTLDFFSNPACAASGYGEGQTYLGATTATTDAHGNVYFKANIAVPEGQFVTATATDANGSTSEFSPCIAASPNNDSWITALRLAPANGLPATYTQYLDQVGQSRWYKFHVQPDSKVVVKLTSLPANYDLTLYKDISATFQALTSAGGVQDLNQLGAEFAPDSFSPDSFSPDSFSPDSFSPDSFSPDSFSADVFSPDSFSSDVFSPDSFSPDSFSPDSFSPDSFSPDSFSPDSFSPDSFSPDSFSPDSFSSAQTRSVIGVSAFDGTASEGILVNTWTHDGDFYVRVRGRNGASSLQAPFHIETTMLTGQCAGVAPISAASSLPAAAGSYKTIILTDWSRLPGTVDDKNLLQTRLATFAARPEVAGVIVDASGDTRVAAANVQADAYPGCPYARNLVADAVKGIVDRYRALNPLEYVVIVGSDDVIPFFRYPDQAMLGSEKNYAPPVLDNTASQASLKLGYVLSQDRYGALLDLSSKGNALPLPGLAVGRLVETAADATHMLEAYLKTAGGVIATPASSLVTGYDFLADSSEAIKAELQAGVGIAPDSLIAPRDLSPQSADPRVWTATQLGDQLLGRRHDLIYLAGHFSANSALAADYVTRLTTAAVEASPVNLENAIVYSAGCHAGYNIVDAHGVPSVTREPDWAQAFARKGATVIAGTGYQYGDTDFIEYSERLYLGFTQQLRFGSGPVAIGKALAAAKQQYLADTPLLRPIHEKAYLEATLFGLPMLSVNLPGRTPPPGGSSSIVAGTTSFGANPGATLGLRYADVNLVPALTRHTDLLNVVSSTQTVPATYFSGSSGVTVNPVEPILPLEVRNVGGPAGLALRGVGFRGGSYTDLLDILPRTGAATTEIRGVHPAFVSNVFYPIVPWRIKSIDALFGGTAELIALPAQYQSSEQNPLFGKLRTYSTMQFRLYYSNNTGSYGGSTPALAAAPYIVRIEDAVDASDVTIAATVLGNPAAGIQEVWATYTADSGPYAGRWQSLDLTRDPGDSTLWKGMLPLNGTAPQSIRYFVQAANGAGLVSMATNMGVDYIPGGVTPDRAPTALTLHASTPSGPYGTSASFNAVLTSNGMPLSNQTVVFGLGSQRRQSVTDSNGRAVVNIPLLGLPADYGVRATFRGASQYAPSSAETAFTIVKQATHLTVTPVQASGYPEASTLLVATLTDATSRPLGENPIFFVITGPGGAYSTAEITDYAGRAGLGNIPLRHGTYTVQAYFSGDIPLSTGIVLKLSDERYLPSAGAAGLQVLNYAPDAVDDSYGIDQGHALTVSAPGVLSNDADADNDPLAVSLVTGPAHGTLTLNPDGSFTYTPQAGYARQDSFTYSISDGFGGNDTATVTIDVHAVGRPPNCNSAVANPISLWPPNGKYFPVGVRGVTDPDQDPVTIIFTGIWQDEPVSGNGPDGLISPDHTSAQVRAKRAGNGDGRVYHLFFTASDAGGLTCTGEVRTTISHDQGNNGDLVDQGPLYDSTRVP